MAPSQQHFACTPRFETPLGYRQAEAAGVKPLEYFAGRPGRYLRCHLQDMATGGEFALPGWSSIEPAAQLNPGIGAGIERLYFEFDRSRESMDAARGSYRYLTGLL